MHDQLKQRLIGAMIIVALVVAFVPMMFDEASEPVPASIEGVNSQASAPVREAPSSTEVDEEAADEGDGYRIIPLTDSTGTATAPKPEEPALTPPESPTEYLGDEGADAVEVPTPDSPLGQGARGIRPTAAPPEKSAPKRNVAAPPTAAEAPRSGASVSPRNAAAEGRPAKPPTSHKVTGASAKAAPVNPPESKKPASGKTTAASSVPAPPTSVPPTKAPHPVAKAVTSAAPERRDDKKTVTKASETPKPTAPAKPAASAPPAMKKADAASKPVAAATNAAGNDAAASSGAAKAPTHAKSMVARKPKADNDSPTRWVVQTYSFTNEANAKILVEKLRKNKFDAFIETVSGSGGVNYRVSIGPEPDKGRAEQARKRLESSVGMSGTVTGRK